jgi:hypothetical protein
MNRQELLQEIYKTKEIIKYLEEQRDYLTIAEAIVRTMPDENVEDVEIPIVRNALGMLFKEI